MTRTLLKLALGASLTILAIPSDAFAGRGGGGRGGGMQRGGGGGGFGGGGGGERGGGERGGGGGERGGGGGERGGGGGERGGGGLGGGGGGERGGGERGGGMQRGGSEGGGTSHSPAFSQPRPQTNEATSGSRNPYADSAGTGERNSNSNNPNAGAAAASAGVANRNQSPDAGAAAAGAGAANRNQNPNAGAAAAGAGYANRNQTPNAGAAAAGATYANRNQNPYSNAGAAAAGATYANRNQNPYPNAGAAAAGATYANRNQYDQYHPGMSSGYWNGNYGASAVGAGVGVWGAGSPAYGYGYAPYSNPYSGVAAGGGGAVQPVSPAQSAGTPQYDYSQPLNTAAAPPEPAAADQGSSAVAQARDAFRTGDYDTALKLTQQALGQMPNDAALHEFLGLVLFAQGNYEQAAAPLYAVLSVGPGWDWTTLIGNYSDADVYTKQLRGLEAFVRANPKSAKGQFVLAYHYISQGQGQAAAKVLESVVALQPNDTLSAQLLSKLQPASARAVAPPAPPQPQPFDAGKLTGNWVAQGPQNAKITLSIKDDGGFTWTFALPGKPPTSISGASTLSDGVLTLTDNISKVGALTGQVVWQDDTHFGFRATGAPADDPGLKFAR
jgi:hypothetical protein